MKWNADNYDHFHHYVSNSGHSVVEFLNPQQGERILDLGCGTGDLAHLISTFGAEVEGIDISHAMIERARTKYAQIRFFVDNAETYRSCTPFDAVFSNAALHWVTCPQAVIETAWHALRPCGRFVAEFGGKGNVEMIIQAIYEVLWSELKIDGTVRNPWFFPSIGEYASLLEQQGFRVAYAAHFDRPTELEDGEIGIYHWLRGFAGEFFTELNEQERDTAHRKIAEKLRPLLFFDGTWTADYRRIRIVAIK